MVFASKYRRRAIYGKIKADIAHILSELCNRKGIEIIAVEVCPDHIHMFVISPLKYSVSEIMGYLKGKSSLMIFDRHANLKYKYGNQLKEDLEYDQMSLKEYIDPFTGELVQKGR